MSNETPLHSLAVARLGLRGYGPHGHSPNGFAAFADPLKVRVGNIVPGEPLLVTWQFTRFLDPWDPDWGPSWEGSIVVRFFIDGQLVHERHDIPVTDGSKQTENIVVRDRNVANTVYRLGRKWLEIVIVRTDKKTASPSRWAYNFWVVPEPIDESWWQWRGSDAIVEKVPWKDGYALIADFVNKSRFAAVAQLSVELSEVRSDDDMRIDPCAYLPVQVDTRNNVAAGGRTPFSFKFLQDWSWLMSGTYVIYGPLNKSFNYAASFQCTDEYGNVYENVCSTKLSRHIGVSDKKQLAAATAFASAASAAGLLIASAVAAATVVGLGLAGYLFAAAGAAYGVASKAGEIAKDPPAPDPAFREPVVVEPLPLPRWPEGGSPTPPMKALRRLLETAALILALENAHTVTRSRLMGAVLFGDREAEERQKQRYIEIEEEMVKSASRLGKSLREIENGHDAEPLFDPKKAAAWADAMVAGGLLPTLKVMAEAGLTPEQTNELAALVTHEWLLELVKQKGLFLVPLVMNLRGFVEEVQGQREAVLAGEVYVEARGSRGSGAQETSRSVEARLRPRKCE
jgi:hypothetical protein